MTNIIRVKNVHKKYGALFVVNNLSFNVHSGKIFGILGPNGAGKTTTLSMMTTLLNPSSGSILVESRNTLLDGGDVRKIIGVVFQESLLDEELTVEENLDIQAMLYFSDVSLRKQQISKVIGLTDLNNHRYKKSAELSGGLKKRLEIARGLLNEPKILFLDEPTLGLDPIAKNNVWAHIKNIKRKQKKTIIIATNDMIEAEKLCDNILIINKGRRCWYGTKQQLKRRGKTIESAFINVLRDNNE